MKRSTANSLCGPSRGTPRRARPTPPAPTGQTSHRTAPSRGYGARQHPLPALPHGPPPPPGRGCRAGPAGLSSAVLPRGRRRPRALRPRGAVRGGVRHGAVLLPSPCGPAPRCPAPSSPGAARAAVPSRQPRVPLAELLGPAVSEGRLPLGCSESSPLTVALGGTAAQVPSTFTLI